MQRSISLVNITSDPTISIDFSDKSFGTPSLNELLEYSENDLEEIAGRLLRSLLIIEYMKSPRLPITITINTDAVEMIVVNG